MGPGRVSKGLDWVQFFATLSRTTKDAAAKQAAASLFLEEQATRTKDAEQYGWAIF
jgi:hypothetical protein